VDRSVCSVRPVRIGCALVATLAAFLLLPAGSEAAYRGSNGAIAWTLWSTDLTGHPSDQIQTLAGTVVRCDNTTPSRTCDFGRPRYSPDGTTIVVSRLVPYPGAGREGEGNKGTLMLVHVNGSGSLLLPRLTVDDEDPAFLPSGKQLVFAGQTSAHSQANLFTVTTTGSGLKQLTFDGGSLPAPCANGTIAFVRHNDIYLLSRDRRSQRRLTFRGGSEPNCAPDSRRIAFVRGAQLNGVEISEIHTIATDGRRFRRLPTDGFTSPSTPSYSPDGRAIAFVSGYDVIGATAWDLDIETLSGRLIFHHTLATWTTGAGTAPFQALAHGFDWQPIIHHRHALPRQRRPD
jgi:WD40 repeat protein